MATEHSTKHKTDIGYFKNQRTEMLRYIPNEAITILEVGCGEGSFCNLLKRNDREIWGIEINSIAAVNAAKECNKILVGDFDDLYPQLPKNYFDLVIFNDVLEHLYNPWETIRKVKSILKPNGLLISSIPNFRYVGNLITEILIEKDFRYKPEGGILDDTHIRFFTSKSILRMFTDEGYEVLIHEGLRPCKSWKEKMVISLSMGFLKDARHKQFATVAQNKTK
ncbi:MAG: class I SAM-dependent methyltransferase [Paludibacteraceae bacterium]|nr:class I SAM-dependent methyltransferase [Paludibacteraceae bacterium]